MDIRGKKVLVFGSGISGEGSCRLLLEKGADVVLYDGNEKLCADEIEAKILETKKENGQFSIVLGTFPEEIIEELSFEEPSPEAALGLVNWNVTFNLSVSPTSMPSATI